MTPRSARRPLRVLISAGPTREPIDPVRFLSNYSTGYLGSCLASEALRRGHRVTLVSGPTTMPPPPGTQVVWVERAQEMQAVLRRQMPQTDVLIMAAAVCDFQVARPQRGKLPRRGRLRLSLKATPDIVGSLPRRQGQVVAGFALETSKALAHARTKLHRKRLDLIIVQHLPAPRSSRQAGVNGTGSPFGERPVQASLLDSCGNTKRLGSISKPLLSRMLFDEIEHRVGARASCLATPIRVLRAA